MADKTILGNVVGYMKREGRRISNAVDSSIGMTKDEAMQERHDNGFYGHIKSGSHKAGKVKGAC